MALCQRVNSQGREMHDILTGDNQVMKVWYLFFRWTGYFVGHKIGIRKGGYMMQMANLAVFAVRQVIELNSIGETIDTKIE